MCRGQIIFKLMNIMAEKLSSLMTSIFDVALILIMVTLFMIVVAAKPVYETILKCSKKKL